MHAWVCAIVNLGPGHDGELSGKENLGVINHIVETTKNGAKRREDLRRSR